MAGSNRILQKLEANLEARNFYEAHQLYRTLYFRYSAQQKYDELISLLYGGAVRLLDNGQFASGFDLSKLLVDILTVACKPIERETLECVASLFRRLKHEETELIDRNAFVQATLTWSKKVNPIYKHGHPELHQHFASVYWIEENYRCARHHFLLSHDGQNCGLFLVEYQQRYGYPSEVDIFLAQAVLQFLCYHNEPTASLVFRVYTEKHPHLSSKPPFPLPLLNFIWLLLLCINMTSASEKLKRFSVLVEQYQPSIARDFSFRDSLDRIGQFYFGLPPPKPDSGFGGAGIFNNLLRSFIGTGNDTDEDSDFYQEEGSTSTNAAISPNIPSNYSGKQNCLSTEELD